MKKSTSMKRNMYLNVHAVLNKHQSAWENVPAFTAMVANFTSKLDLLEIRLMQHETATKGISADKKFRLEDLRERMLIMQKALKVYATAIGDRTLEARNKTTKSELQRLNISKLSVRCSELKSDIQAFGSELVPYGITGEMIAELIPILESVDELNISTRQAIIDRKSVTKSISDLHRAIDDVLNNQLDDMLLVFKTNQAAFFEAFRSARMIIGFGKKNKPGGTPEPDDGGIG